MHTMGVSDPISIWYTIYCIMDFTDVPMLKVWPILANANTDINIGASLVVYAL